MLALERPLGVVAGLALFGDHADRNRVYWIATRPQLAAGAAGQELSFVKFQSADAKQGGVGLLSFTTELVASERQLEAAREHLERQGIAESQLVQVPWTGGKAVFAAALQEGDGFVEKMLGEVTPDLAGGNRAMFSVRLTDEGARLIEALSGIEGPSPLGVRYELEYAGLRPALAVKIRADYERIYSELSWGFQFGVAYEGVGVRASVESATQKLIENGAIQVEVLQFNDSAELAARVDAAVRWFQERILEDFFKSSLQPPAHDNLLQRTLDAVKQLGAGTLQDVLKDATAAAQLAEQLGVPLDALQRLGAADPAKAAAGNAAGGAAGSSSTFALKLQFTFRDIDQTELKTITLDWQEAHAEKRTAAPQGLLSRFGGAVKVIEATDAGSFWETLDVNVRPLGDFAELGVQRLVVQLAFPDEITPESQKALSFEPGEDGTKRFAAWTNGRPPRYRGRNEVHFDEQGPWPGPPVWVGDWRSLQSLELAVHPLSELPRLEIEISPGTVVFAETPQVQVDLRLDERIVATHMLTEAAPKASFRQRFDAGSAGLVPQARCTWFLAEGGRVEGEWLPVGGVALLVHRPWRSTRSLRLLPLLPDDFLEALVTLTLNEGSRSQVTELRFEPGERRARTVSLPCLSEQPPLVQVDVLVIRGDGSSFLGAPFQTGEPVVIVRDRDGVFRQVSVRLLAGPTLQGHGLMAVQVQLLDAAGATLDQVVFTESQKESGLLLVPAEADAPPASYRVTRYRLDGSAVAGEAMPVQGSELLVPAVVQA